jgi:hypothetical protein
MGSITHVSTGLKGLDDIIDWLRTGDNVVWQVDGIADYKAVVKPFVENALKENCKVVYMRFAHHEPVLEPHDSIIVHTIDPGLGFESFSTQVHTLVSEVGEGAFYVFDSLSDLLTSWATDLMTGNFFHITCPYLFELRTVAYFAIIRNRHSYATVARIRETTQVLLDAYNVEERFYIQPLKVWNRYSPTMFLPHLEKGDRFIPLTSSVDAARLFTHMSLFNESSRRYLDYWDRLFMDAKDLLSSDADAGRKAEMVAQLCDIMVTRDPRMGALIKAHFTLEDMLEIKTRLIGSGFIGGKSVGLLLARKILAGDKTFDWSAYLEPHDSFYIGSDVFYSFLVNNGCWNLRMEQKTREGFFTIAPVLAEKILKGVFPDEIKEHFFQLMEYFGQCPLIVRSSSLLEDSFGNAFAGKYESIFCANQGSPEQRYANFEKVVKRIYASTMNEDALTYRLQRGLEFHDEQMALLVQRVSGSYRKNYFFPDIGGVGVSHNTFVWKTGMDPDAGMIRMVLGLGTRAVDRVRGDYPRVAALDDPLTQPVAGIDEVRTFSQHDVDLINTEDNELQTKPVFELLKEDLGLKLDLIAVRDEETSRKLRDMGRNEESWIITFDELLSKTPFTGIMRRMLKTLEKNYEYPVDIEYVLNFTASDSFQINLVQCRPHQTIGEEKPVKFPEHVPEEMLFFSLDGDFMGGSISQTIAKVVIVETASYGALKLQQKYEVARIVGMINRLIRNRDTEPVMLLGPGRWGSTTPSLGVPVHFSEINNIAVLGEMASREDGSLMPELSYGTHFFQDLVENRIFFVAIFPWKEKVILKTDWLNGFRNLLSDIVPGHANYGDVIKVYDVTSENLRIVADIVSQHIVCYRDR